jgi:hypothetical protein
LHVRYRQDLRVDDQQERILGEQAHGLEVLVGIVCDLAIHTGIDREFADTGDEHRVAVSRCARRGLDANHAGRARPIVRNDGLAERSRKPGSERTRYEVGASAGGKRHDELDRLRWIGLGKNGRCANGTEADQ